MIEHLKIFQPNTLAFVLSGHVTKDDYDSVLIPAVEAALKGKGKLRLHFEIDPDFSGIDPGAVWEDIKLGMEHLSRWERIAVVTNVEWVRHAIQAFRFLMPGQVKIFPLDQAVQAREWIAAKNDR